MSKTYTDEEVDALRNAISSEKQRKFAEVFSVCLQGTQAAIEAGYSAATAGLKASNLKNLPKVKAYIEALLAQRRDELKVTKKEQYNKLVDLYNQAIEKGQISAAAKIIEIQNKMAGIDTQKDEEVEYNFTTLFGGKKI